VSSRTADVVRRDLAALADADVPVDGFHEAALSLVARVVPHDAACWGAVDPETMVLTSGTTIGFTPSADEEERFVTIEYGGMDASSFSELVARGEPVLGSQGVAPIRRRGLRFNEVTRSLGFGHELRTAFLAGGRCWAVGDLYRSPHSPDFDADEIAFVESIAPIVARGTRRLVLARSAATAPPPQGPAVIVLRPDGSVRSMTPAAREWTGGLAEGAPARFALTLRSVAATVAAGMPAATARMRAGGVWVVLDGSPLHGGDGAEPDIVVAIHPAASAQVTELLLEAHGLSPRERDVCAEVLAGRSTEEIARRLFIAPSTVQDHLKAIFAKVAVRSRRELVATLRAEDDPG